MSLTITKAKRGREVVGSLMTVEADITLDTSYPSGGYAITAAKFGGRVIRGITPLGGNAAAGAYVPHYDKANKKLMVFRSGGHTPAGTIGAPTFTGAALTGHTHSIPAGTDAGGGTSGSTSGGTPAGTISAPTFTGTAVAAAALSEVSNGVNLSSVTFRVEVQLS